MVEAHEECFEEIFRTVVLCNFFSGLLMFYEVFAKQENKERSAILLLWHAATAHAYTLSALPPGVDVYRSGPLPSSHLPRSFHALLYQQPLLTQLPILRPPPSLFVLLWRRQAQATPNRESKSEYFRMPRESAWRHV